MIAALVCTGHDLTKLGNTFHGSEVAEDENVTSRYRCDEASGHGTSEAPIPQTVDQDKAGLEITLEEDRKHLAVRFDPKLFGENREVLHRMTVKFALVRPRVLQMPVLNVLEMVTHIHNVGNEQAIAQVLQYGRIPTQRRH